MLCGDDNLIDAPGVHAYLSGRGWARGEGGGEEGEARPRCFSGRSPLSECGLLSKHTALITSDCDQNQVLRAGGVGELRAGLKREPTALGAGG